MRVAHDSYNKNMPKTRAEQVDIRAKERRIGLDGNLGCGYERYKWYSIIEDVRDRQLVSLGTAGTQPPYPDATPLELR